MDQKPNSEIQTSQAKTETRIVTNENQIVLSPEALERIAQNTFRERLDLLAHTPQAREALAALARAGIGHLIGTHEAIAFGVHGIPADLGELGYYPVAKLAARLVPAIDLFPDLTLVDLTTKTVVMEGATIGVAPSFTINTFRQMAKDREKGRYEDALHAVLYLATGRPDQYEKLVQEKLNEAAAEFIEVEEFKRTDQPLLNAVNPDIVEGTIVPSTKKLEVFGGAEQYRTRHEMIQELQKQQDITFGEKLQLLGLKMQNWGQEKTKKVELQPVKIAQGVMTAGLALYAGYQIYNGVVTGAEAVREGVDVAEAAFDLGRVDWRALFSGETLQNFSESTKQAFALYNENITNEKIEALPAIGETVINVTNAAIAGITAKGLYKNMQAKIRQHSTTLPHIGNFIKWLGEKTDQASDKINERNSDDEY